MSYTIKELESLSGIKAHTIRIWEQRYNFLRPSRTQTNIRRYNNEELKTLLTVALLNRYGFKISRIDEMTPDQRADAVMSLQPTDARIESTVNRLIGCMVDMDNIGFEQILNGHIAGAGIEKTIVEIIFRFLERVGILWQTNRLRPVQEHVVSNIIRQKIINAIDGLSVECNPGAPVFALFIPEGEYHELGLLYVHYMLRKRHLPVVYLGPNVPVRDIHYIHQLKSPAYYYLHLTFFHGQQKFNKFISSLQAEIAGASILISGHVAQLVEGDQGSNVTLFQSLADVQEFITAV